MIELVRIRKEYRQGRETIRAVDGVSLTAATGEFLVINGKSGCGKSTLLSLIGGLDLPDSGEVLFNQKSLSTMSDAELTLYRRKEVGTVFQAYNLIPILSVEENVALPAFLDGQSQTKVSRQVESLLDAVSLLHRKNHRPYELSGGEMQRTAIARALINSPSLIIADEPTGNLDSKTGCQILELLNTVQKKYETTVIMATHSRDADKYADRILQMRDGKILDV